MISDELPKTPAIIYRTTILDLLSDHTTETHVDSQHDIPSRTRQQDK